MTIHRHQPGKYTYALVLAKLLLDDQAEAIIADRIGDCAQCWRIIADHLATEVWSDMIAKHGMPTMHPSGLIEGRAISVVCSIAQDMIECAEADARDDARYYGDDDAA